MAKDAVGTPRLAVLLAAAMFVFVIDTSLMNVSISAVVRDLDTTVSGVQAAVAIEALVSASFILIGSKLGDLFGRKRAYVVGPDSPCASDERRATGRANWRPARGIQDETISINTDARHLALQVALLVTLLAALIGLFNASA